LSKNNVFVVNDLSKDFRFIDHPFVSGPPHVKFYAGAPLVTPEGYKIGTVCIIDTIARPNGLTEDECNTLTDLANMTLKVLVDRRYQLNKKKENSSQLLSYAAHDMMAPLTSVHLSLSILNNDAMVKRSLGEHQQELLHTALSCSELLMRICNNTLEGLGQLDNQSSSVVPASNLLASKRSKDNKVATTNMKDLVKRLQMTVDPIPKKVPCIVTLDNSVPNVIVGDDLKLFRCAVNLLTNAIDRTTIGKVHLTIRWDGDTLLLFECEDCGPDIPVDDYQNLFQRGNDNSKSHMGLLSIALLVDSLDGEYGLRPKDIDNDGNIIVDSTGQRRPGCLFWFSIPLILPEMLDKTSVLLPPQPSHVSSDPIPLAMSSGKNISLPEQTILYQVNAPVVGTTPYSSYPSNLPMLDQKRHISMNTGNSNFISSQGIQSETDPDIMDELGKLALDLNASLTDFEPFPVETDNDTGSNSVTKDMMRKRRALVIDDSIVVRRSLSQTLNQLGFDVVQAGDGVEGMKELQQTLFDIVLCDFMMPVMDGVT
jgi:CheY-like chemotaxis protein